MSLQGKMQQIGTALYNALGSFVHHYFRPDGEIPSCVWQEDGEDTSFYVDNDKAEQPITGTIDYFTKAEFDPNTDVIQATLRALKARWRLESVQYEDTTKLIHYEWRWSVTADGVVSADPEEPDDGDA